jgi:hypothetical protein
VLPSADAATVRQLSMLARAAKKEPPSVLRKMYPPFTTPTISEPDADIEMASQLRTVSRVDHVAPASELR